jgi:hypothetical protein
VRSLSAAVPPTYPLVKSPLPSSITDTVSCHHALLIQADSLAPFSTASFGHPVPSPLQLSPYLPPALPAPCLKTLCDELPLSLMTSAPTCLGILTKADRTWRQTRGSTWYTRHHTATLPSHLAKHTMGHNLLLALSYHVRSGLKRIGPTIATAPRSTLHIATIQPRFPNLGGALPALPSAFFSPASARLFPYGNSEVFFISFHFSRS